METKTLIKAGKLLEARKQLVSDIKAKPQDVTARTHLFQVLSFLGEWDKAGKHLEAVVLQDQAAEAGVQVYKNIIQAEKERLEVFRFNKTPSFIPKKPPGIAPFFDALKSLNNDDQTAAEPILEEMEAKSAALKGICNGQPFVGFKDTDSTLTLFMEAIEYERYVWIPVTQIREIVIEEPKTLFDLLWIKAMITTWKGLTMGCFLPVLYPNSFTMEDENIKMGRRTEWTALGRTFAKGYGQRVFQIGEMDIPILEIREVSFEPHDYMEISEEKEDKEQ